MIRGWTESDHQPLREKLPFKQKFSHVIEVVHTPYVPRDYPSRLGIYVRPEKSFTNKNYRLTMEIGQNYWFLVKQVCIKTRVYILWKGWTSRSFPVRDKTALVLH
jgi:hypothetical protein